MCVKLANIIAVSTDRGGGEGMPCEKNSCWCRGPVRRYGYTTYSRCLSPGQYHDFCESHASQNTCPVHGSQKG